MQITSCAPISAALALLLLGACSKPDAEATAANTETAAAEAAAPGGAVSAPPSPQNDAVNTQGETSTAAQTPGSNSFTEAQARGHIEKAGYSDVTALTKTPEGLWAGKAMKDGKAVDVALDFKGVVTAH